LCTDWDVDALAVACRGQHQNVVLVRGDHPSRRELVVVAELEGLHAHRRPRRLAHGVDVVLEEHALGRRDDERIAQRT